MYALPYWMHKWPAVAPNMQQLLDKMFLSHFSWETQEANSKPIFHCLENWRVTQHECGLMTHCGKAQVVLTGDLKILEGIGFLGE